VHSQPLPAPLYKKLLNLTLKQKMIKVFLVLLIVVFATAATKNESSSLNRRLLSKSSRRNLGECQDNLRYKDSFGDSCEEYEGNKHWCGNYDTTNFKSDVHCCVCGGGKRKNGGSPSGYNCEAKKCVNGQNIVMHKNKSRQECAELCDVYGSGCKGFEYGVHYGGAGRYEPRDCQLQSSSNSAGCDGEHHNLDLCTKQ